MCIVGAVNNPVERIVIRYKDMVKIGKPADIGNGRRAELCTFFAVAERVNLWLLSQPKRL